MKTIAMKMEIGSRVLGVMRPDVAGRVIGLSSNPELYYVKWDTAALNYGADGSQEGSWMEPHQITLVEE
jgi:hypothetical protein